MIQSQIRKNMEVIGSCGNKLGSVDCVEGRLIKLSKTDSADGTEHYLPVAWIDRIDQCVHLNRKCIEVILQRSHFSTNAQIVRDPDGVKIHDEAGEATRGVPMNNPTRLPDAEMN